MKKYKVGDKIKFAEEKQRYTIKACDERWLICTKPLNCQKTFLYTIVDLVNKVRGADNYYCKHDYINCDEAEIGLKELNMPILYENKSMAPYTFHELEISHRNRIPLNIV